MARKALLVGINDYAPVGPGGPDLRGCVNDVYDMANTLNALGIVPAVPANLRILTDSRATRANIIEGLQWLIKNPEEGDLLIFYYSGHGSRVADINGDELDSQDETICPHDFATAGMIKDDDLRASFSALFPGVNLEVILDSCHSGSGTRDRLEDVTIRYVEPPLDYGFFVDANPWLPVRGILKAAKGEREAVIVPGLNHVLWAGCRDNQTSAEASVDGVYRGIFTYCFCKVLRRASINISRRRLDSLVSLEIKNMGYSQVPQVEGTLHSLKEKVFT